MDDLRDGASELGRAPVNLAKSKRESEMSEAVYGQCSCSHAVEPSQAIAVDVRYPGLRTGSQMQTEHPRERRLTAYRMGGVAYHLTRLGAEVSSGWYDPPMVRLLGGNVLIRPAHPHPRHIAGERD